MYAAVASTIFNIQYFVTDDAFLSTILAYFGLALSFFIRPLGGVVFAHIGDRIGRKITFIITLSLMGIATAGIGFLPIFEAIGIAAPILLLLFRVIQGMCVETNLNAYDTLNFIRILATIYGKEDDIFIQLRD